MQRITKQNRRQRLAALTIALGLAGAHTFAAETMAQPGRFDPRTCVKPVKPTAAQAEKRSGAVMLAILIGADGTVQKTRIVQSSGHADLDEATRAAFAKCTFKAGTVDGVPTAAWQMLKYIWTADDNADPALP